MKYLKLIFVLTTLIVFTGCDKGTVFSSGKNITPKDFLANDDFDELVVEIRYVDGFEPTPEAVDNLVDFLSDRLNKSGGITVIKGSIPATGKAYYTIDDIQAIENEYRTELPKRNTLTAFFFFADAGYVGDNDNSKVLGVAYSPTAMAVFQETVQDNSGGLTQPSAEVLESTVMMHEFGHILGLVNAGTRMQSPHQDGAHGHHCDDSDCLMYYAMETTDVLGQLVGNGIPELDDQCIADLQANGGK